MLQNINFNYVRALNTVSEMSPKAWGWFFFLLRLIRRGGTPAAEAKVSVLPLLDASEENKHDPKNVLYKTFRL